MILKMEFLKILECDQLINTLQKKKKKKQQKKKKRSYTSVCGGARGVMIIVVEFKSWTRLIAFHIALIPLGKVWIQLFSLQLWVNSRTECLFSLGEATSLGEGKLWIQPC